ncbi:hypothetical protein B9G54_05075 [Alloscardovia macacae]|uniref:NagC family transcriptional regulator n=1 Tax=Alloscardovia macacae TaxID=1160091 RepID=A0A1Y2STW3_9BIFI|nr:ROK family transcriptional regulator [Alloscardovia macacae]OTA26357.1 hypothetical protein B9G54_05075 [Alloscardovia macacae]OTA28837.1 hypothetical protein B9T39_05805 [Alloscardovia macacae]
MSRQQALNQDTLRAHNIGVVLSVVLRSPDPISRADIARATGMTKAAISIIVSDLIERKILVEGKPQQLMTTGKPSSPLEFADGQWLGLGVQVHTDGYGFLLQDFNGNVVDSQWVSSLDEELDAQLDSADVDAVLGRLEEMIAPVMAKWAKKRRHVIGGALALPGMITGDGVLINAPNLGWSNVALLEKPLVKKYALTPVNEANAAAIAQISGYAVAARTCVQGQDGASSSMLPPDASFLFLSTDVGIGGAYVSQGKLVAGDDGLAGEIGHVSVQMDGPLCRCGRFGCMEMYAGRRAVLEACASKEAEERASAHFVNAEDSYDVLLRRMEEKPEKTQAVMRSASRAMASAIVSAMNIVDITRVVIGGFWTRFGSAWLEQLREDVVSQLHAEHAARVDILFAPMDDHAGLHGAAEWGLRRVIDDVAQYVL